MEMQLLLAATIVGRRLCRSFGAMQLHRAPKAADLSPRGARFLSAALGRRTLYLKAEWALDPVDRQGRGGHSGEKATAMVEKKGKSQKKKGIVFTNMKGRDRIFYLDMLLTWVDQHMPKSSKEQK